VEHTILINKLYVFEFDSPLLLCNIQSGLKLIYPLSIQQVKIILNNTSKAYN